MFLSKRSLMTLSKSSISQLSAVLAAGFIKTWKNVGQWVQSRPDGGSKLNVLLSPDSVRHGKNHIADAR